MSQKRYLRVFLTISRTRTWKVKEDKCIACYTQIFLKYHLWNIKGKIYFVGKLCIVLNIKYFEIAWRYILAHLALYLVVLSNILKLFELLYL